jgi:hypothetical protein
VHQACKTRTQYVSCSTGPSVVSIKKRRTHYVENGFLHRLESVGHVVHSGASGCERSMHYFSCSGGPGAVSRKSVLGHVALNFYFCIRWDLQVT